MHVHHFQPVSALSPEAPTPALCPWSVALTVRVGQRSQQTQGCHTTCLAPTAQLAVQKHNCLFGAASCYGEEIAFSISRQLPPTAKDRERAATARQGIAQSPLLTLQHDAVGQHCLMGRARLLGHVRELWEQGPF